MFTLSALKSLLEDMGKLQMKNQPQQWTKSRKIALPLNTCHFKHRDRKDIQVDGEALLNTDSILVEAFMEMYLKRNSRIFKYCLRHDKGQTTH